MRLHGRDPSRFPAHLERHRAVFADDEFTYDMDASGAWEITITPAGWQRVMDGEPDLAKGLAFLTKLYAIPDLWAALDKGR
jgi:hypothetical protein